MKLFIFSVRDSKTASYGSPMSMVSKGQAIRAFTDQVNNAEPNNMLHSHPEDFELFFLGTFDDESASFESVGFPTSMITASDCVKKG